MDLKFVEPSAFVVQFILILTILWVLNKFLFKPYLEYLDKWEERHKKLEKDYNNIDKLIQGANDQKQQILAEAKDKWNELINEAKALAEQKWDGIVSYAKEEANNLMESSKQQIERERLAMMKDMKSKVVDIALKLNAKLFDKEKVSRDYLEKNIDSVS